MVAEIAHLFGFDHLEDRKLDDPCLNLALFRTTLVSTFLTVAGLLDFAVIARVHSLHLLLVLALSPNIDAKA